MDFDIVARNTVTILSRRITDTVGLFVSFDRPIRSLENPNGPLGQELFDDPTTGHIERVVGQLANFNPTQVLLSGTILDPDRFVAKERDVVPGDAMLKGGQFSLGNTGHSALFRSIRDARRLLAVPRLQSAENPTSRPSVRFLRNDGGVRPTPAAPQHRPAGPVPDAATVYAPESDPATRSERSDKAP